MEGKLNHYITKETDGEDLSWGECKTKVSKWKKLVKKGKPRVY